MSAISTAMRYGPENGPIVFGIPGIAVRWNQLSHVIVVEVDGVKDAKILLEGEEAENLLLALAAAHRRGLMAEKLRSMLEPAWLRMPDEWYRCGKFMLRRPT